MLIPIIIYYKFMYNIFTKCIITYLALNVNEYKTNRFSSNTTRIKTFMLVIKAKLFIITETFIYDQIMT